MEIAQVNSTGRRKSWTLGAMARSFSVSQANKLGEALRKSDVPTPELLAALQSFRLDYDPAIATVEQRLRSELGLRPSSRLKTVHTIIDKLKRSNTRLSKMQDVAGVRVVGDWSLAEQDDVVRRIGDLFPGAEIIDRRAQPSAGYRAVHMIVEIEGLPVEIQVRTRLQDTWAQVFEKLADVAGRSIRYGGEPEHPGAIVNGKTVADALQELLTLSSAIAQGELLLQSASELQHVTSARTSGRALRRLSSKEIFRERALARRAERHAADVSRFQEQLRLSLEALMQLG